MAPSSGWTLSTVAAELGALGMQDPVSVTGAAVLLYTLLYWAAHAASVCASAAYAQLSRPEQAAWCSRVVSTAHAVVACVGYMQLDVGLDAAARMPCATKAFETPPDRALYLLGTLAYLVYDLLLCTYHPGVGDRATLLHHAVIIAAYAAGLHYGYGTFYMAAFLANEATTPLLNLRYFLQRLGHERSRASLWNGVAFAAGFAWFRIRHNAYVLADMADAVACVSRTAPPALARLPAPVAAALPALAVAHAAINAYWFARILGMVARLVRRRRRQAPAEPASSRLPKVALERGAAAAAVAPLLLAQPP